MVALKISIVVPSFNQVRWLRGCIESILSQNYANLELIVMDGGSTDGSVEIIESYADRISYWQSQPDGGQYCAIEDGLNRATGEVLGWLNADDLYLPWTLRTIASVFSQLPEVEWLTSNSPMITSAGGIAFAGGICRVVSKDAFLDGLYVPGASNSLGVIVQEGTFWRRSLWERTMPRFTTVAPLAGDFELWSRFFKTADIHNLALPLAAMTRHREQRSNAAENYREEAKRVLCDCRKEEWRSPWRAGLARFGFPRRTLRGLTRRICAYQVNAVEPVYDSQGYFERWRIKTLAVW